MPFKTGRYGEIFTPEELQELQRVYDDVCDRLLLPKDDDELKEKLAKIILTLGKKRPLSHKVFCQHVIDLFILIHPNIDERKHSA